MSEHRSRRPILGTAALFVFSLLSGLVIVELSLRLIFGAPPLWRFPQEQYVEDAESDYLLRPLQDSYTMDASVHVNSRSIRGDEYPPEPELGVIRILAMGDSQTFGMGLELNETWPKQLEVALSKARPGTRFEVLNAGLPASSTVHQARRLPALLAAYEPHCVVVGVYVNDVIQTKHLPPFQVGLRDEENSRWKYLAKRSATLQALVRLVHGLLGTTPDLEVASHEVAVLRGVRRQSTDSSWREVDRAIADMRRAAENHGACLVLMAMPRLDQVLGQERARGFQERLIELATPLGIAVVDPLPQLVGIPTQDLVVPWDGHYASAAQQAMAQALAPALLLAIDTGWPQRSRGQASQPDDPAGSALP